jgi:hypothetical protein
VNRRQLIVLWVGTILLSMTSGLYGWDEQDLVFLVVLPVVMLCALLVIQWRDSVPQGEPGPKEPALVGRLLVVVVLLQGFLLVDQHRSLDAIHADVSAIASSIDDVLDSEAPDEPARSSLRGGHDRHRYPSNLQERRRSVRDPRSSASRSGGVSGGCGEAKVRDSRAPGRARIPAAEERVSN